MPQTSTGFDISFTTQTYFTRFVNFANAMIRILRMAMIKELHILHNMYYDEAAMPNLNVC